MKIAILGTRGIPNNYGGFERAAEKLSVFWIKEGHKVTVYNPDYHPYKENNWNGIRIKHIFSKENKLGLVGNFLYDFLCLKDAVKEDYDIILNMGYVPSALFFNLRKKTKAKFVTNMDGIEWKRDKWNRVLKEFIKYCEQKAVSGSDYLIADHPEILKYYKNKYNIDNIAYIPYGADLFENPKEEVLEKYDVEPYKYYMLIARLEPENNIEMILDGYLMANPEEPFLVIGGLKTKYAKYLLKKYKNSSKVRFLGGIYNYDVLSTLRWYSKLYFHGHSIGGTNPSLLEAMASNAYIAAHYNPFNKYILGEHAFYFRNSYDIRQLILEYSDKQRSFFIEENRRKIEKFYNWELISYKYLRLFKKILT